MTDERDPNLDGGDGGIVTIDLVVADDREGVRLDRYITDQLAEPREAAPAASRPLHGYSRTFLTRLIREGEVEINDGPVRKPATRLRARDRVRLTLPPPAPTDLEPEDIPLDVLYEDEILIVVNKPAGLIVHPTKTGRGGTLANALLFHCREHGVSRLHQDPVRPGIVHRLDKDTSGAIVCAKDEWAHFQLARQFHARTVEKEYRALAYGAVDQDEITVEAWLGRHPRHRELMTVVPDDTPGARSARTHFHVLARPRFTGADGKEHAFTWWRVQLDTGRTHQIRVHARHLGHPLVADQGYAHRGRLTLATADGHDVVLDRQALHAYRLSFTHPLSNERLAFTAPLPVDLTRTLDILSRLAGASLAP